MLTTTLGINPEAIEDRTLWENYVRSRDKMCGRSGRSNRRHSSIENTMKVPNSDWRRISGFDEMVIIKDDEHTALVAANVTMEKLVEATQRRRFIPKVVDGHRLTTVVDAFARAANAPSFSQFETFDSSVLTIEIVHDNGQVLTLSTDPRYEHNLLRHAGALPGRITMLEVALIPAGPSVEVLYTPVFLGAGLLLRSIPAYDATQYVEYFVMNKNSYMLITGSLSPVSNPPPVYRDTFGDHVNFVWQNISLS